MSEIDDAYNRRMTLHNISESFGERAERASLVVVDHGDGKFSILKDRECDVPTFRVDIIRIIQRLRSINGTTVLWVSMPGS